MSTVEKIFILSSLTIFGVILVLTFGKSAVKFFTDPIQDLRLIIEELSDCLYFFGNVCINPTQYTESERKQVRFLLQEKAFNLDSKANAVPIYSLFEIIGIVPPKKAIRNVLVDIGCLINSTCSGTQEKSKEAINARQRIRDALDI